MKLKSGQESNKYICKNAVDCSFEIGGQNINPIINSKLVYKSLQSWN